MNAGAWLPPFGGRIGSLLDQLPRQAVSTAGHGGEMGAEIVR
jgi:hypothetical protein